MQPAKGPATSYPNPFYLIAFLQDENDMKLTGSEESKVLWQHLRRTPDKLARMVNLKTFSLTVSTEPVTIGFWIPRPVIAQIVEALPEACVNLEIDSRGNDYFEPGSGHICDTLRGMLPRLRHLRLRLSTLCPAFLGSGFKPEFKSLSSFEPLAAPCLQTLVVNCIPRDIFGGQAHICGTFIESRYPSCDRTLPEARIAIVDALCLAKKVSRLAAAKSISVLYGLPHLNDHQSIYGSFHRCEILKGVTWVSPYRNIMGFEMDTLLIRTPEGQEHISYPWVIEALAEGGLWGETVDGFRLPTNKSTIMASDYIPNDMALLNTKAWKFLDPEKSCMLWLNEEVSSPQRLSAKYQQRLFNTTVARKRILVSRVRSNNKGRLQEL